MRSGEMGIEIRALDAAAMKAARARHDSLTKPPGSLGQLEEIAVRICGIRGEQPRGLGAAVVILCAADHGVTEEAISAYPREVTAQMLANFASGGAAINVLSRHVGAKVVLVDAGVAGDVDDPRILKRRIRNSTANIARGPAMSVREAEASIALGIEVVEAEIDRGAGIIATGEMGIGNTTASSALIAALTGCPVRSVVGRGTGIDDSALENKTRVIERALAVNRPSPDDPVGALAKVGGLEIGALAGVMLGGAARCVPVVIDGFISGAAALLASRIEPRATGYLFPSHLSLEPGHRVVLDELGLDPILNLGMRLGEGTGAALAIPVIEASLKILNEMATFEEAGISRQNETE